MANVAANPLDSGLDTQDASNPLDAGLHSPHKQDVGLWGGLSMLANQYLPSGNIVNDINNAPSVLQGVAETGQSVPNLIDRGINSIAGTNFSAPASQIVTPNQPQSPANPMGYNSGAVTTGRLISSAAPFIASDGLINPASSYLTKVGLGAASGATQGALGAANNSNASIGVNSLLGLGLGTIGSALGNAIPSYLKYKGANASLPGSAVNSPQETAQILQTAKANGMNPDLGTAMNSAGSSGIYNDILGMVPGSGVGRQQENIVGKTQEMANDIMDGLKGTSRNVDANGNPLPISPGDIGDHLKQSVADNMKSATQNNSDKFNAIWDEADDKGIEMGTNEFPNTAAVAQKLLGRKSLLGLLPTLPDQFSSKLSNIIKLNPNAPENIANNHIVNLDGTNPDSIDSALNASDVNYQMDPATQSIYKPSVASEAQPETAPLGNVHSDISDIGNLARQAAQTGDMKTASFYTSIKNAMNQDLNNKMSQIPGLADKYKAAKQDFATNVVPYRQQSILNVVNNKTPSAGLPNLLTGSNNQKIFQDLNEGDQNKVIYSKLKNSAQMQDNADIGYSPAGVINGYKDIQKNLPSYLMNDNASSQLDDLSRLNKIYTKANANVTPPYTGFRAYKNYGKLGVLAGMGLLGMGAHFAGADIPEAIGSGLAAPLAARAAGKILRSNTLANAYTNPKSINNINLEHPGLMSMFLNQGHGGSQ